MAAGKTLARRTTCRWSPLAGLIIAIPAVCVAVLLHSLSVHALLIALLVMVAFTTTTGALHEDGLADVADGFGGGHTVELKLDIMRDRTIGTYAGCSISLSLAIRAAGFFIAYDSLGMIGLLCIIFASCSVSRAAMLWPWSTQSPARKSGGLSANHGQPTTTDFFIATIISVVVLAITLIPLTGFFATAMVVLCTAIAVAAFVWFCQNQVGGHTGDTLGATQQIAEIAVLVTITSWIA